MMSEKGLRPKMFKNHRKTKVFEGFGVRLRASWGRLWAVLGRLGAVLGPSWAILGRLGRYDVQDNAG